MGQMDYKELKNNCFMRQADKDRFSLRLRIAGGKVGVQDLKKVYELAEKYGEGYIHLTSRQSIEIPFLKFEELDAIKKEMQEAGLRGGFCGARVRTITACQGCTVCQSGLIDSADLAQEFDALYYGREVPHKFKIGITGCHNNCLKAEENDLGIKGAMKPVWNKETCTYCGLCESKCRHGAIHVDKQNKTLVHDESACILCGKCVKACPVQAWTGEPGFKVYIGGLFGNSIQIGRQAVPIVYSKEELHAIIEATIEFFKTHGKKGERLGKALNRIGWEPLFDELNEVVKNHKKD
ncbi:4Fe-4S binding protein [Clostridium aminobutyricum]|uniref:4Fe-4S binding protein n=1 Tax=Clostridium aminobutyricum TaxID=33953 RepID=A0A939IIH2_CLOAM|nr:4Fe-4S binding protein [Clostridium aminobutyricum]MBN7772484.1 4Fe-4S binding protein [Clostridium aminobutyricum]